MGESALLAYRVSGRIKPWASSRVTLAEADGTEEGRGDLLRIYDQLDDTTSRYLG
jgi:hypothetical protein